MRLLESRMSAQDMTVIDIFEASGTSKGRVMPRCTARGFFGEVAKAQCSSSPPVLFPGSRMDSSCRQDAAMLVVGPWAQCDSNQSRMRPMLHREKLRETLRGVVVGPSDQLVPECTREPSDEERRPGASSSGGSERG